MKILTTVLKVGIWEGPGWTSAAFRELVVILSLEGSGFAEEEIGMIGWTEVTAEAASGVVGLTVAIVFCFDIRGWR